MEYIAEIRKAWRPLLAAMLGLATGNSIVGIVTSAIAPSLVADAGWSRSDFAMVGSLSLPLAFVVPLIGRLTDLLGVRLTALIGLITVPLVYVAYSLNGGSLTAYMVIFLIQTTVCVTTTSLVYTRLVVTNVVRARGLALALVTSSPALAGVVIGPMLNAYVELHGWQAAYQALAFCIAVTGLITFLLIPKDRPAARIAPRAKTVSGQAYRDIFRLSAFWILATSMLLCNLPGTLMLTQIKLLVMDQGISGSDAAVMFSAVSIGMLTGRIVTGLALDRFRPHLVAAAALGVPSLGLFVLASPLDAPSPVMIALFLVGFAYGSEGDALAFLVARHFPVAIYSSVMGLLTAIISVSVALGAILLSVTLDHTEGFDLFLSSTGVAVAIGALVLIRLGSCSVPGHIPNPVQPNNGLEA